MPSRAYHEGLWQRVPEGLEPSDFALRSRFLLERVQAGERVLDVGCGEGRFAAELARAGARVVGVDVAEEPLRRARARHPELDLRLVDGEGSWELADASFDVVWAGEVIEHVADTAAWLSEVRRVLRSGGQPAGEHARARAARARAPGALQARLRGALRSARRSPALLQSRDAHRADRRVRLRGDPRARRRRPAGRAAGCCSRTRSARASERRRPSRGCVRCVAARRVLPDRRFPPRRFPLFGCPQRLDVVVLDCDRFEAAVGDRFGGDRLGVEDRSPPAAP